MRTLPSIITLTFLISLSIPAIANHIVGNEANYKFISFNPDSTATFQVNYILYRDEFAQNAAPFDDPAEFGLFKMSIDSSWIFVSEISVILDSTGIVPITVDPCIELSDIGTEIGFYSFTVDLPINDGTYLLSYLRCCRSASINNLDDPGDTGISINLVFSEEVISSGNSSPVFQRPYPFIACNNEQLEIDQAALDIDGDEIRYSFCPLLSGGGPIGPGCTTPRPSYMNCLPSFNEVIYEPAFSAELPLGLDSNIQIDPITGTITGRSAIIGKYAIGICVEEYRNGILLGRYIRDAELNIIDCIPNPVMTVYLDADGDGFGDPDTSIEDCLVPEGYVTDMSDCDDTDTDINPDGEEIPNNVIDEDCDGLDIETSVEELKSLELQFYPNPARDRINISYKTDKRIPEVKIHTLTGQLITKTVNAASIDISNLESGIYFLVWKDKDKTGIKKLIKSDY